MNVGYGWQKRSTFRKIFTAGIASFLHKTYYRLRVTVRISCNWNGPHKCIIIHTWLGLHGTFSYYRYGNESARGWKCTGMKKTGYEKDRVWKWTGMKRPGFTTQIVCKPYNILTCSNNAFWESYLLTCTVLTWLRLGLGFNIMADSGPMCPPLVMIFLPRSDILLQIF